LEAAALIPRYQRVLFWILLGSSVLMAALLIRLRERAHDRLTAAADSMPLVAPAQTPTETITLLEANDTDGSLIPVDRTLALPTDPNARARVLLQKLLSEYADPKSTHPLGVSPGVEEVFLRSLPNDKNGSGGGETAIVNLSAAFVEQHPSGIEPETMTLLSIIGTLHANLPSITQVRFLVDGQPRETLAGHADLTRVYLAADYGSGTHP
jgi:hypothetical protein